MPFVYIILCVRLAYNIIQRGVNEMLKKISGQKPQTTIKKPKSSEKEDLDDFIFKDENIKVHSEK